MRRLTSLVLAEWSSTCQGNSCFFFSTEVEKRVVNAMTSRGQRTISQELGMMAVLGALKSWQDELGWHRLVLFTDSEAVRE